MFNHAFISRIITTPHACITTLEDGTIVIETENKLVQGIVKGQLDRHNIKAELVNKYDIVIK